MSLESLKKSKDKLDELERLTRTDGFVLDNLLSNASIIKTREWIDNVRKDLEVNPNRWTPEKIEVKFGYLLESLRKDLEVNPNGRMPEEIEAELVHLLESLRKK